MAITHAAHATPITAANYEADHVIAEGAAPGTPDSGYVSLYAKTDGLLYSKDDAGVESAVSGAGTTVSGAVNIYTYTNFR